MTEGEIRYMERLREMYLDGEITSAEFRRQYDPMMRQLLTENCEMERDGGEANRPNPPEEPIL